MQNVRAKFKCDVVTDNPQYESKSVSLSTVIEGSDENKSFSKYTPSGSLQINICYETEASNFFEVGKEYYLDFSEAEK